MSEARIMPNACACCGDRAHGCVVGPTCNCLALRVCPLCTHCSEHCKCDREAVLEHYQKALWALAGELAKLHAKTIPESRWGRGLG